MRPKASSSVVEYPILIVYPSMYGMLKVCSVKDLLFRISSACVKFSLRPDARPFLLPVDTGRYRFWTLTGLQATLLSDTGT